MTALATANLRVVARRDCDTCKGRGEQASEDWQGFHAWADRRGLEEGTIDREDAVEDYFLQVAGMTFVPPLHENCDQCDGRGVVDVELPFAELLEEIVARVETPIVPPAELDAVVDSLKKAMTGAASKSQGLADADEAGSWLRACQEAAEALRAVAELRPRRREPQ